jgi:hypothetical protein
MAPRSEPSKVAHIQCAAPSIAVSESGSVTIGDSGSFTIKDGREIPPDNRSEGKK